jgi:hypothetical protein
MLHCRRRWPIILLMLTGLRDEVFRVSQFFFLSPFSKQSRVMMQFGFDDSEAQAALKRTNSVILLFYMGSAVQ